jgi:hypothetical protein
MLVAQALSSNSSGARDLPVMLSTSQKPRTRELAGALLQSVAEYMNQGGLLPSALPSSANNTVLVYVDGIDISYTLTESDLYKVFSSFGSIVSVHISQDGTNGLISFSSQFQASLAVAELNGKRLTGFSNGVLRVIAYSWSSSSVNGQFNVPIIRKYTCRFEIQIENDKDFFVAKKIIGQKGSNMKKIVSRTGSADAKLRLRGRGSGFLEGAQKQESQEPLHLCVSCKDYVGYRSAIVQVEALLNEIYDEYRDFCQMRGDPSPKRLKVVMHEHPLLYQQSSVPHHVDSPSHAMILSPPLTPEAPSIPPPQLDNDQEDIERLIEQRNEARRVCNFKEADRIRDLLRIRGIGLMDEPGGRGRGTEVTSWRFWR